MLPCVNREKLKSSLVSNLSFRRTAETAPTDIQPYMYASCIRFEFGSINGFQNKFEVAAFICEVR